jgi:hypothetical protein
MDQEHLHEALIANDALILREHACCCMTIREYGWLEGDLFAQQRFCKRRALQGAKEADVRLAQLPIQRVTLSRRPIEWVLLAK